MSEQYDTMALEARLLDLAAMYRIRKTPDGWEYTDEGRRILDAADALAQQRSDLARLRAALQLIASCDVLTPGDVVDIARKALRDLR